MKNDFLLINQILKRSGKVIDNGYLLDLGKILLIAAGADGVIAPEEMKFYLELFEDLHTPDRVIDELKNFDWKEAKLDTYLSRVTQFDVSQRRWLLYQSIRIVCADKIFEVRERKSTRTIGETLGLDVQTINAIENLAKLEHFLLKTRLQLFGSSAMDYSKPTEPCCEISVKNELLLGIKYISRVTLMNVGKTMLIAAGADGEIAAEELATLLSFFRGLGGTPDMIEELKNFNWVDENIEPYCQALAEMDLTFRHRMFYITLKVTHADRDYSAIEKIATEWIGEQLGMISSNISAIQGMVNIEHAFYDMIENVFLKTV
ncbi:MAG: TerB family tellurite resistance protein [SAR324 cluster bacterium]|nr:TerB family tellurite resistance protein [SAR324 cluster bacterium]